MLWFWIVLGVVVLLVVGYVVDKRFAVGPWHDGEERRAFDQRKPKGDEQLPTPGAGA